MIHILLWSQTVFRLWPEICHYVTGMSFGLKTYLITNMPNTKELFSLQFCAANHQQHQPQRFILWLSLCRSNATLCWCVLSVELLHKKTFTERHMTPTTQALHRDTQSDVTNSSTYTHLPLLMRPPSPRWNVTAATKDKNKRAHSKCSDIHFINKMAFLSILHCPCAITWI